MLDANESEILRNTVYMTVSLVAALYRKGILTPEDMLGNTKDDIFDASRLVVEAKDLRDQKGAK